MPPKRPLYNLEDVATTPIPAEQIDSTFKPQYLDLISAPLGGRILAVSDEWFAPATNLLLPSSPIFSEKQIFTGQWMDGWETRRHNKAAFDYSIIRLGVASGTIAGIEVDTTHFKGNEAPAVSVEGCSSVGDDEVVGWGHGRGKWETLLGIQPCLPSHRHGWRLAKETEKAYTHIRLNMYPDGGIARFRLYGTAIPILPSDPDTVFDLAAAQNGGKVISCSDECFGTLASNLLLPGRGPDMADGWETARSRSEDHVDWCIVKLGREGMVRSLVVDTLHFRGNFPESVQIAGLRHHGAGAPSGDHYEWKDLTALEECGPDKELAFDSLVKEEVFTHIRFKIFPDGGVKRLRVFGVRKSYR